MRLCSVTLHLFCVACFDEDNTFCVILIRKLAAFYQIEIFLSMLYIPYVQEKPHGVKFFEFILRHTIYFCVNIHTIA